MSVSRPAEATNVSAPPSLSESGAGPGPVTDAVPEPIPVTGMRGWAWNGTQLLELHDAAALRRAFHESEARIWVDLQDADPRLLTELSTCLDLHPLIVEDIHERNQRAKIEVTGPHLHLVLFAMEYTDALSVEELDIVLGERFLLTSHGPGWQPMRMPGMRYGVAAYLREGPDYLLWALVDGLVDGYFPVYDRLSDRIDDLQEEVIRGAGTWIVEPLFRLRRDLLQIRHVVAPQREILNQLTNRNLSLIRPKRSVYFRDVYDHLIRLADELDTYRELVGTTLDAYLSTVNNNLSEIMKRLTAVTAVLAGVGALAGIFGMSEAALALSFGDARFWVVTALIAGMGFLGVLYFRRIDWL